MAMRTAAGRYWSGKRKRASTPKLAPAARKAVKAIVKRTVRSKMELKYFDSFSDNSAGPTTFTALGANIPAVQALSLVTQGTTDQQRIGDKLQMVKLRFKCTIKTDPTIATLSDSQTVRCLIVQYLNDTTTAAFNASMVFQNVAFDTTYQFETNDIKSYIKILYDRTRIISNVGNLGTFFQGTITSFRKNLNFVSAGTVGSGHLYLVVVGDSLDSTGNLEYYASSRLNFTDS